MKSVKNKGFTILEVLISSALAMFLFFAVFYTIGNIISKAILIEKKVELADELDDRVNSFMLSAKFDDSPIGGITFSQSQGSGENIQEFTATNADFSLFVIKRVYASLSVAAYITQALGPYMQAASAVYRAAGSTVIDDPVGLAALLNARKLLPENSSMWSSNTGVALNIGNTYAGAIAPLPDPPIDDNIYITIAPHTNADISSEGVKWTCTVFDGGKDLIPAESLPSWCVV